MPSLASITHRDPILRVRLIGQIEIRAADGRSLLPAGRKTRALFAMLALSFPRSLSRTRAAETLWSRRPMDQARASLRQELHRLLDCLGPLATDVLDVARDQMQLRPGSVWLDAAAVQLATLDDPEPLDLLNGTLMDGLSGIDPALDAWIAAERERLSDWSRTLADRILQGQVDPARQIEAASRLLTIDRAHEGAWRSLMRAYSASGDPAMALQAFDRCRSSLADRLKRAPSAETERLVADIRGNSAVDAEAPVPARSVDTAVATSHRPEAAVRIGVLGLETADVAEATDAETRLGTSLGRELCVALARFRWSEVICLVHQGTSRPSNFAIRGSSGIDLLVDGAITRSNGLLRVNLRLLDLRSGGTLVWSRRFEQPGDDLLALQDEIAALASAQLDVEMVAIETKRATTKAAGSSGAYNLTMQALARMYALQRDSYMAAAELLQRAVGVDPTYAPAWSGIALLHMMLYSQGWTENAQDTIDQAADAADRAVTLDPRDARSLTVAGIVASYLQHRVPQALALHERATATNPNLPMAWAFSAFSQLFAGDTATADEHLARYKHLAPMMPNAHRFDSIFIYAALLKRDFVEARRIGREVSALGPTYTLPLRPYLAALGHLGDHVEAAEIRERLVRLQPDFGLEWFARTSPFERDEDTRLMLEGLRLAGVT